MKKSCSLIVLAALGTFAQAAPLADLSGGQTGRIEFNSTTPAHRWALIRGRPGPAPVTPIYGDLLMPNNVVGKVPAVVFSHGSDGFTSGTLDVWAKPLNAAGYAVFMVESFKPRGEDKITGPVKQLNWNVTGNISDALHALKLLSTHPQIDAQQIYHLGWSRGGVVVLDAAWPTYQQQIVPKDLKWAGSIALYPGCSTPFRTDRNEKLPSPMLFLLGEKDDMTAAQPCVDYAKTLAAEGNDVTYKVYPDAYHVFDRPNQPYKQYLEGNFVKCDLVMWMPTGPSDPSFGGQDNVTGKAITTGQELADAYKSCQRASWITVESNSKAREQSVKDVLTFMGVK